MNPYLPSGPTSFSQRILAALLGLFGLIVAGSLLVFGFFVGAALIGLAALFALVAWVRIRFFGRGPEIFRAESVQAGDRVIDGEFVVVRKVRHTDV